MQPQNKNQIKIAKLLSAVMAATMFLAPVALADSLQDQINALNQQANQNQQTAAAFGAQADTLANKLSQIQAQSASIEAQLQLSHTKQVQTQQRIDDAKQQLAIKKAILDEEVRAIYQDSQITPLEMLASSKNFSDYVDKQQYNDQIKDHVQDELAQVNQLKADLEKQQAALQITIRQQGDLAQSLQAEQSQQAQLLADTRGQESLYTQQAQASSAQASQLKAQQAAELAARFGSIPSGGTPCGGGYPSRWCNAGQDTIIDNWGMYNRECVSYAAFKVATSGHNMPYWGGRGNAKQWPGSAAQDGIPVDSNPGRGNDGTVAITTAGPYGHAMYVESVSGGSISVSQYNFGNQGEYSTMTISSSGLQFIHF